MFPDSQASPDAELRADARRNRERIVHVAVEHFGRHGIGTSLEEIARAACVGAGTLYRHFPSREALVAAALRERQAELAALAQRTRAIADADAALRTWVDALEDYLHTFGGLPAPVLEAVKVEASPLALSCDGLIAITAEFLERAQREGSARPGLTARDLFLGALAVAFVLGRAQSCGTSRRTLNDILAHGYLGSAPGGDPNA